MSTANDILFEPIAGKAKPSLPIDLQMIDAVKIALTGVARLEFFVDTSISVDTYDAIADLVENDSNVVNQANKDIMATPFCRPANALIIKEVFRRLYAGESTFWFCAKANGNGIQKNEVANWFTIDNTRPIIGIVGVNGVIDLFPWWIVSLMSNCPGYGEYYAFASEDEARRYYGAP